MELRSHLSGFESTDGPDLFFCISHLCFLLRLGRHLLVRRTDVSGSVVVVAVAACFSINLFSVGLVVLCCFHLVLIHVLLTCRAGSS